MKPHIKVIQRNGVDIFVTSSMTMKEVKRNRKPRFDVVDVLSEFEKWRNSKLAGLNSSTYNPYLQGALNQGVANTLGNRFFGG